MGLLEDLASRLDGLSAGWALSARRDVVEGDTAVWHALAEEARELQERVVEALDDVDDAVIHIELNDLPTCCAPERKNFSSMFDRGRG
jgi:hypothetical protein